MADRRLKETVQRLVSSGQTDFAIELLAERTANVENRRGPWPTTVIAILGLVVSAAALWFGHPSLQAGICQADFIQPVCAQQHRKISPAEATAFIDNYLENAGGADPSRAWPLLGGLARDAYGDIDTFRLAWMPITRAERTSAVDEADGPNVFYATYREYRVPVDDAGQPQDMSASGFVVERGVTMKLVYDEAGRVVFDELLEDERLTTDQPRRFALATFQGDYTVKNEPNSAVVTIPAVTGSHLRVHCELERDGGLWFSSPSGWFPADVVELSQVPDDGNLACSPTRWE